MRSLLANLLIRQRGDERREGADCWTDRRGESLTGTIIRRKVGRACTLVERVGQREEEEERVSV